MNHSPEGLEDFDWHLLAWLTLFLAFLTTFTLLQVDINSTAEQISTTEKRWHRPTADHDK